MKAIIQLPNIQHNAQELDFIEELPFIKISGKMILDYYFDFLYQLNITEVFICGVDINIHKKIEKLDTLNLDISYIKSDSKQLSYTFLYDTIQKEELLILEGFGFIKNNFNTLNKEYFMKLSNSFFEHNSFQIFYINQHTLKLDFQNIQKSSLLELHEISSMEDYFFVSDLIFKDLKSSYFLPGYSNEKGIIIGKNVEIDPSCELIAPVIIMDNVKICEETCIGPNAVINQNVFIEPKCEISNSVVYDNTYLNTNLKLDYKFILSNIIVDRHNKKVYNIDKKFAFKTNMKLIEF